MPQLNHMIRVICPLLNGPVWANSCKGNEYRCCRCGQKGHEKVRR